MDYGDFGRYLSQQRELRGVSREEVAKVTRIPLAVLLALEEGNAERLPARVFVINYIRAYARAIGLEPEETVLRFQELNGEAGLGEGKAERKKRKAVRRYALVLLGVAVVLLIYILSKGKLAFVHR